LGKPPGDDLELFVELQGEREVGAKLREIAFHAHHVLVV
jgi:hypothetical protein